MWAASSTEVADIISTSVDSGEIRANLGYADSDSGIGQESPVYGIGTILSRPADAVDGAAPMALYTQVGDQKLIFAWRDNRYSDKAGALQPGDTSIVSTGPARFMVKDANKSVTLYTENEKDDDSSQMVHVEGKKGENIFLCGEAIIRMRKDEIVLAVSGGGSIIIDKTGVHIAGNEFHANAPTVTLGVLPPGVPPQLKGLQSALYGVTGMAGVASNSVLISP